MTQSLESAPNVPAERGGHSSAIEQRFVIHGVSFKDYVVLREALDIPGLRMTYCEGVLELMSPSTEHEDKKKTIARLIELYALERDVTLYGYGNATFRREAKERGCEPDECWTVGGKLRDYPDVALEVIRFVALDDQHEAAKAYRDWLRGKHD
jgi:Uma2 family endonuclease